MYERLHEGYDIFATADIHHSFVVVLDEVLHEVKVKLNGDHGVAMAQGLYQSGKVRGEAGYQVFVSNDSGQSVGALESDHLLASMERHRRDKEVDHLNEDVIML